MAEPKKKRRRGKEGEQPTAAKKRKITEKELAAEAKAKKKVKKESKRAKRAKKEMEEQTKVDLEHENVPAFIEYLSQDVDVVDIPHKDNGVRENETYYPPLLLDGASGTGKTQQAFASLRNGETIIYILLSKDSQAIYRNINQLTAGFRKFRRLAAKFMTEEKAKEQSDDIISTNAIADALRNGDLKDLLCWMAKSTLRYDSSTKELYAGEADHIYTRYKKDPKRILDELQNKIMFVDEAMPHVTKGTPAWENAIELLRFVRIFGRLLKMRVIAAGTSAVVSNMMDPFPGGIDRPKLPSSRVDPRESFRWALCRLLSKPMKMKALAGLKRHAKTLCVAAKPIIFEVIVSTHRPLFVKYFFREVNQMKSIKQRLEGIGRELFFSKSLDDGCAEGNKAKAMWLMGVWLQRESISTSPYSIEPPDLVRGHFFEPAMMSLDNGMPRTGYGRTYTVAGPLEATIYNISQLDVEQCRSSLWVLSARKGKEPPQAAESLIFDRVRNAFSVCVQQCLFREPLLAIALSRYHRYGKDDDFRKGVSSCFKESVSEFTLSAVSGEQLELVTFAALQQANGRNMDEPNELPSFCAKLVLLLSPTTLNEPKIKADVAAKLEIGTIKRRPKNEPLQAADHSFIVASTAANILRKSSQKSYSSVNIPELDADKTMFSVTRVPWLVPACVPPARSHLDYGNMFSSSDMKLAALVPGGTNANCDIDAYKWPPDTDPAGLEWKFEVKARNASYTMEAAVGDLVKKCGDDDEVDGLHHAMAISVRGTLEPELLTWRVKKMGKWYFRIVILISGS